MIFKINDRWVHNLIIISLMMYILALLIFLCLKERLLPWSIYVVPMGVFYMLIGTFLRRYWEKLRQITILLPCMALASGVLVYILLKYDIHYEMDSHIYGNVFLISVLAIIVTCAVILFSSLIPKNIKWLSFVGRNSMTFYGLKGVFIGIVNVIFGSLLGNRFDNNVNFLITLAFANVTTISCGLFSILFNKFILSLVESIWSIRCQNEEGAYDK